VDDTNPSTSFTGQLTDVTQVEKFELSESAYAERTGELVLDAKNLRA
jgi:tubulin-folding cofactor B